MLYFNLMKKLLFVLILASLLLAGCTQPEENPADGNGVEPIGGDISMELIETGDTVKIEYEGSLENGEVFDSTEKHDGVPLEFVAGAGQMIKGFDEAVIGMRLDEEKTVTLEPAKAYGPKDESKIVEISKENFGDFWSQLKVGMPVSSPQAGNGTVLEMNENSAKVDFNHALAGKTLVFKIKVVGIEKAS